MAGKLITFEGGEGAGKTTQIKKLVKLLEEKGFDVLVTREPGGTDAGDALRQVFIDHKGQNWDPVSQALWIFTVRRLHVEQVIKPALKAGNIIISDRFTDSTRVYQGIAGGMDAPHLERIKHDAIGDFEPDLTFILDIDPKTGLMRAKGRQDGQDTFEDKAISFHESLRQGYQALAQKYPERCQLIDANRSKTQIFDDIVSACLKSLA